ncbi:beta-ketoacyl-[acyl-carrier-protein] synthase II, partial [bacterium]|nr:beta-ketoacyl-[acyl-carrier-protein] synthase II [bacterium]
MKRVVITGMGCISSLGYNVEEFNNKLFSGQSGIGPITLFDATNFRAKVVAEVK